MPRWGVSDWDGHTQRSDPGYQVTRYEATCLACGEAVEPTDAYAWRRAVLSLRCERCGGRMLIDPIDAAACGPPCRGASPDAPTTDHSGRGWRGD